MPKTSVPEMLCGAVDTLRPMAARKNLYPECSQAYCDAGAVHQILINLLDNAIKYTPEGRSVAVTAKPEENALVEISVCDSGIGFPPEDLPRGQSAVAGNAQHRPRPGHRQASGARPGRRRTHPKRSE
jgi:signal transduction histidine kinase